MLPLSAYWELKEQQTAELVEIGKQDNNKPHDAIELATFMHDFYEDASAKAGWGDTKEMPRTTKRITRK